MIVTTLCSSLSFCYKTSITLVSVLMVENDKSLIQTSLSQNHHDHHHHNKRNATFRHKSRGSNKVTETLSLCERRLLLISSFLSSGVSQSRLIDMVTKMSMNSYGPTPSSKNEFSASFPEVQQRSWEGSDWPVLGHMTWEGALRGQV